VADLSAHHSLNPLPLLRSARKSLIALLLLIISIFVVGYFGNAKTANIKDHWNEALLRKCNEITTISDRLFTASQSALLAEQNNFINTAQNGRKNKEALLESTVKYYDLHQADIFVYEIIRGGEVFSWHKSQPILPAQIYSLPRKPHETFFYSSPLRTYLLTYDILSAEKDSIWIITRDRMSDRS
jgi:hypothetical protein